MEPIEAVDSDRMHEEQYLSRVLKTLDDTVASLREEIQSVNRRMRDPEYRDFNSRSIYSWALSSRKSALQSLEAVADNPYFGRFDFQERDVFDTQAIYIGTYGIGSAERLVYDWRAPICSVYFQSRLGSAAYTAPDGTIEGTVTLRRQYKIENRVLISVYDDNKGLVDHEDPLLLSMLQRQSSDKMRQIVASIQAEQDAIIRATGDILIVHGPAGSGKTVVALHRAAYLLFQQRMRRELAGQQTTDISAKRMLVFSPNAVFSDYISKVLTELHEDEIGQVVLDMHLVRELQRQLEREGRKSSIQIESRTEQYEYMLAQRFDPAFRVRVAGTQLKSSRVMIAALNRLLEYLDNRATNQFFDIHISSNTNRASYVFYGRDRMLKVFRRETGRRGLLERIDMVIKDIDSEIGELRKQVSKSRQADDPNVDFPNLYAQRNQLNGKFGDLRNQRLSDLYLSLWQQPVIWEDIRENEVVPESDMLTQIGEDTITSIKSNVLHYEDVGPFMLLNGLYRGFSLFRQTDHAIIDEAQDYSVLDYELIERNLPDGCGLTIVGDLHQAIHPTCRIVDFDDLNSVFLRRVSVLQLTTSYRSSFEIGEFAARILSDDPNVENVRRTGKKPQFIAIPSGSTPSQVISELCSRLTSYNTVAILCKTTAHCDKLYEELSGLMGMTRVREGAEQPRKGVLLLPVHLAKGLEFDAVILHDGGEAFYSREDERNLLYTACTRALHELFICYTGQPSLLFPSAQESLWQPYEALPV